MSKRIKKFRDSWEDDEWGNNEDTSYKKKDKRLQNRKNKRKEKFADRWYDEDFNLKRKKQQLFYKLLFLKQTFFHKKVDISSKMTYIINIRNEKETTL